ncbi:hypothetical protein K7H09_23715 [Halomonas sp. IOP_14]|uniref:HAD family hydrolase n=1 Tax=Halomonas sp. IOP_14 TaxID=2873295 RepID=UPI001E4CD585|nr:HAD family hydrolase [Halomonas sp. IOP_14]MCD1589013.1 hypothetical protein [Halomonas sp. IOP_14]
MLKNIKYIAIDTDGVLLNDTYSPVIKKFVEKYGVEYTSSIERSVWGSPQITAGHNLSLACKLPHPGEKVISDFFKLREEYLEEHPVEIMPKIEIPLKVFNKLGIKVISYGGRNREYSFDRFLSKYKNLFDSETPYIDINAKRPGMLQIIEEVLCCNPSEVIFIDDINRVAETCKSIGSGFIGVPASMNHNFQLMGMQRTGVKHMVKYFSDIDEGHIFSIDKMLTGGTLWS